MLCPIFFKLFIFYWSIAGEQCCHSFRKTVKEISHTYTYTHSPPKLPSHPGCHVILNRVQLREGFVLSYIFPAVTITLIKIYNIFITPEICHMAL